MFHLTDKQAALDLAAAAAGALIAALIFQYGFHLAPCELCIYQRVPYGIIIVVGLLGTFGPVKLTRPLLVLITLLLAIECGLAVFHVGVEQKWWEGLSSCKLNLKTDSIDALREQLLNAPRALCGDVAWSLFGISMAGYNALLSFGLFVLTILHLGRHSGENGNPV